jgi:hypothetical protein
VEEVLGGRDGWRRGGEGVKKKGPGYHILVGRMIPWFDHDHDFEKFGSNNEEYLYSKTN